MLMSSLRPEANSQAVKPLSKMPMAATKSTVHPATGSGFHKRCTASQAIAPTAVNKNMALKRAASMDVLLSP